eukprot:gene32018-16541_t
MAPTSVKPDYQNAGTGSSPSARVAQQLERLQRLTDALNGGSHSSRSGTPSRTPERSVSHASPVSSPHRWQHAAGAYSSPPPQNGLTSKIESSPRGASPLDETRREVEMLSHEVEALRDAARDSSLKGQIQGHISSVLSHLSSLRERRAAQPSSLLPDGEHPSYAAKAGAASAPVSYVGTPRTDYYHQHVHAKSVQSTPLEERGIKLGANPLFRMYEPNGVNKGSHDLAGSESESEQHHFSPPLAGIASLDQPGSYHMGGFDSNGHSERTTADPTEESSSMISAAH